MTQRNNHIGGLFEDWLKEEWIHESVQTASVKRVLAWQLEQAMMSLNLTKTEMARRMDTSRPQLDRLLDPDNNGVTLDTLTKAAHALGRQLLIDLI